LKPRLVVAVAVLAIGLTAPIFAQNAVDLKVEQQIRALAQKYDDAINRHDAVAVAALYARNGVWRSYDHGSFYGQKAIEKAYARWVFTTWQVRNYLT
jgi:ketosteroid isomerase-like protein